MSATAPRLIGREDELAAIAGALDVPDELPATLVLHGDTGVGKTSVWLAAVEHATAVGYRVLACRPAETETKLSYAGVADLLDGVTVEVLAGLPPVQQRALGRALLLDDASEDADERAVAAAFLASLRHLAGERPVCLAIDDLQWLDAASLGAVGFAQARLGQERVASLLSVRGGVPSWVRRSTPPERLTELGLRGLTVGALGELLRARVGRGLTRPALLRIWETSAGNPFFALELAQALERRGPARTPRDPLPLSSSLDELLAERLDGLGADALAVATAAAVLSEPTTELVAAALGGAADPGIADALDAGILELEDDRLRLSHPLLGSAVLARQTHTARRALHARLAEVAPTREERARHLAAATVRPDRRVASRIEEAARAAHARGAPLAAAELADEAHRLTPRTALVDKRRRLLYAADRYYVAADIERATALLERARDEDGPGRERAVVLIQLGRMSGNPRAAVDLLDEALADAAGDDALVAEIHLMLAGIIRFVENIEQGLEHAKLAVVAAARTGDAAIHCRALASYGLLHFNAGRGIPETEMEQALGLERSLPQWPLEEGPAVIFAYQLVWTSDVDRARDLARELELVCEGRGDIPGLADALWYRAFVEWRAGDWVEAERYAAADLELTTLLGKAIPNEEFPSAIVDAHLGRVEAAVRRAETALGRARHERMLVAELGFDWVLGFVRLSLGDLPAAVESLRRAHEARHALGMVEPAMCFELGDLLEALVGTDALDDAERLLTEWEARAVALDRAWALAILARGRGLLYAARGDLETAASWFERAKAEHARTTDPFQHARTLLALGRTQRRAKQRGAARTTLEDALARFETLGAPLWAEQARAELARIGGRTPSGNELTEAESRIARLVADGHTNREVAAALFLTEHSVETALTRIYRKLGVRSRSELALKLAAKT